MKHIDILIIGAGISGSVLAERYATIGKKVLIIDKRNHIAGNCYDYTDENGFLISKYGTNSFHTNDELVWNYVNQFSEWNLYKHHAVENNAIPVSTKNEPLNDDITHAEGIVLNEAPSITSGKTDLYQALPKNGYTQLFKNMLDHPNIEVLLETDYFDIKDQYSNCENLFYTGPVDHFFEFTHTFSEKLECRSINFVNESFNVESFDDNSDMDQAFKNALDLFEQIENNKKTIYKTAV